MSLSCECDWGDYDPGMKLYYQPKDYTTLQTSKAKRCCSCNELIRVGDICSKVNRVRVPKYDVEINIYGEDGEISIAPAWMCEECTDISFSLEDLGFCDAPWEDQKERLAEYQDIYAKEMPRAESSE